MRTLGITRRHSACWGTRTTVTTYAFSIRTLETGQFVGQATLCAETKYCAVLWHRATRPDRRLATVEAWDAVVEQLRAGLTPGPLDRGSAIAQLLCGRARAGSYVVQLLWAESIEAPAPLPLQLDRLLRRVDQH